MEILAAAAVVGALSIPGWLFKRVPVSAGSAVTLVLFFCAAFFTSLADDPDVTAGAVAWGTAAGALGGAGFYAARRLQTWERRHPVDPESLSPSRERIRRIGVPACAITLVWTGGGAAALVFEALSFAIWISVAAALYLLCGALWIVFVRSG